MGPKGAHFEIGNAKLKIDEFGWVHEEGRKKVY